MRANIVRRIQRFTMSTMSIGMFTLVCLSLFPCVPSNSVMSSNDGIDAMLPVFHKNFYDMDMNNDSRVTQQEYTSYFMKNDKNGDGKVTLAEYIQDETSDENRNVLSEEFAFYDKNGDRVVGDYDLSQDFQAIDSNRDGDIEESEFVNYATHLFVNHLHPAFAVGK